MRLVRVEVEPALPALVGRPAVPGDRQRLQAAIGKLDQVLLQRIEAEGVLHLEDGELAVGTVGLDEELAVLAKEARAHARVVEAGVVEVAEHRSPVACCIASLCCDGRHRSACARWHSAQVVLPTNAGGRSATSGGLLPSRSRSAKPPRQHDRRRGQHHEPAAGPLRRDGSRRVRAGSLRQGRPRRRHPDATRPGSIVLGVSCVCCVPTYRYFTALPGAPC